MQSEFRWPVRSEPRTARSAPMQCLLAALFLAASAGAQQVTPGVVAGIIRNDLGAPLDNAVVALDANNSERRVTRVDAEGRFRFERVSPGEHEVSVVSIGFRTDIRTIQVPAAGLSIDITLHVNTSLLDTLHILARRTGVYGTVLSHDGFQPLASADVQVIGNKGASAPYDSPGTIRSAADRPWGLCGLREAWRLSAAHAVLHRAGG